MLVILYIFFIYCRLFCVCEWNMSARVSFSKKILWNIWRKYFHFNWFKLSYDSWTLSNNLKAQLLFETWKLFIIFFAILNSHDEDIERVSLAGRSAFRSTLSHHLYAGSSVIPESVISRAIKVKRGLAEEWTPLSFPRVIRYINFFFSVIDLSTSKTNILMNYNHYYNINDYMNFLSCLFVCSLQLYKSFKNKKRILSRPLFSKIEK